MTRGILAFVDFSVPDFLPTQRAKSFRFHEFLQDLPARAESADFQLATEEQDSQESPKGFSGSKGSEGPSTELLKEDERRPFEESDRADVFRRQSSQRFSPARVAEDR